MPECEHSIEIISFNEKCGLHCNACWAAVLMNWEAGLS